MIPLKLPKYSDIGKIELTPAFTAFDDTPQFDEDDKDFTLQQSEEVGQKIYEKKALHEPGHVPLVNFLNCLFGNMWGNS